MQVINEEELKKHRCCFTGHRPHKLGISEQETKKLLLQAIEQAIAGGYVTFISGMAIGVDLWAAEIVLEKKRTNSNLHIIAALPHPDFEVRWDINTQKLYHYILENADIVKTISEHPYKACYQKRNQWMVDRSNLVIAAYNGEKGGTKNTINYANQKGIQVNNIFN